MVFAVARRIPGLVLVVAVSALAWIAERVATALVGHPTLEAIVLAILIGALVRTFWTPPDRFAPGVSFAAGLLLEVSIVLLGFGADLQQFIRAGVPLVASIVGVVVAAIVTGVAVGRALGLSPVHALLVACGNAICGNSAIAALAPVVGARRDEVASAIAYTAVLGVVVILGLPFLAPIFGLNDYQYGILAGLTVYAVPQVIAAAYPVSVLAGQTATLVKLVRVLDARAARRHPVAATPPARTARAPPADRIADRGARAHGRRRAASLVRRGVHGRGRAALRRRRQRPVRRRGPGRRAMLTVLAMAALGLNVDVHAIRRVGPKVAATVTGSLAVMVTIALVIVKWIPR